MKSFWKTLAMFCLGSAAMPGFAGMNDDPLLYMLQADRLEWQRDDIAVLEFDAWLGRDLNKAWLTLDWEQSPEEGEHGEIMLQYSRAIAPFWDIRVGIADEIAGPGQPTRAAVTLEGLAPYWFELEMTLLVDDDAAVEWQLEAEYEVLLSQRLILSPSLELQLFNGLPVNAEEENGLANIEAGLRLRYELRREFAPYVGVEWHKNYGAHAEDARWRWVLGVRAWF